MCEYLVHGRALACKLHCTALTETPTVPLARVTLTTAERAIDRGVDEAVARAAPGSSATGSGITCGERDVSIGEHEMRGFRNGARHG